MVGVLGAATFAPAIGGSFIYDDHSLIGGNIYVHSFGWWQRWFSRDFWDVNEEVRRFGRRMIYWRPAISASYALDWEVGHGSPMFFHVMNLAWHSVASVLAFVVLRRWLGAVVPAALAALLFAVHPTKAESVAWIAGRTDILCAVAMLTVAEGCARRLRGRKGGLALEIAGTIAAYATKEQAVALAAFVAVESWVALDRPALDLATLRRMGRACVPQLGIALAYLVVRARFMPISPHEHTSIPLAARLREVFETMGRFAAMTFFPHDLSVQQGLIEKVNGTFVFDPMYMAIGVAFVALLLLLLWTMRIKKPGIAVGIAFYLLMLLPTSNVVPTDMTTMLSERFLYIPMLGLSLAVGTVLVALSASGTKPYAIAGTASIVVALALGIVAARHSADFADERAFWDRELALHPLSLEALRFKIADEAAEKNFDRALELTARAEQTAVRHYQGAGFELDFIVQGVQLLLAKIPDHDTKALRAVDRFLESALDPRSAGAELALGQVHIAVGLENQPGMRARIDAQRPLINGLRAATKSRLVEDEMAIDLSEEAHRECPGCFQIGRISALVAARAGQYDRGHRFLDEVARWTSPETVLETQLVLRGAEATGRGAANAVDEAQRLQLRATELSKLEAWGRAFDVLAPAIDAIRKAPDFALGFAELAWRAGEFRIARDVLSTMMPASAIAATTEQWSRKMGWIDGPIARGLTHDPGHGKEGP
jgi:hypothetical protein